MMKVIYDSKTGLGKKFAEKIGADTAPVSAGTDSPCILVTRNVGLGMIPGSTKKFLKKYAGFVLGVVVNGDKRFGKYFCAAGPKIEAKYKVPVIRNIELDGNDEDVKAVLGIIENRQP